MGVIHAPPPPGPDNINEANLVTQSQYLYEHSGVSCQQIAETILGGLAASIVFLNIPQTYRDLLLAFNGRGDAAGTAVNLWLRINGDTTNIYDTEWIQAASSPTVECWDSNTTSRIYAVTATAGSPVGHAGFAKFYLYDYARTAWQKMVNTEWGFKTADGAGGAVVGNGAGNWRSTAAITQLTLMPETGNFVAGTRATLWGLV